VIFHNGKTISVLNTNDVVEAANAYDKYIFDNKIPGRNLNFPEKYPLYEFVREIRTFCKLDELCNGIVYLVLNCQKDAIAPINEEDYERIKYYGCGVDNDGYVTLTIGYRNFKLSRYITNTTDDNLVVDHINSNTYDNRRVNLRVVTRGTNSQNLTKPKGRLSKYKGVTYSKSTSKWISIVTRNYKQIKICSGDTDEDTAGRRRDLYMMKNFPDDHCKFNFDWTEEELAKWREKLGY